MSLQVSAILAAYYGGALGWTFKPSDRLGDVPWEEFFDNGAFLPIFVHAAKQLAGQMGFDAEKMGFRVEKKGEETMFGQSADLSGLRPKPLGILLLMAAVEKVCEANGHNHVLDLHGLYDKCQPKRDTPCYVQH